MSYVVDFNNVSTVGLESSPAAEKLAGLRANEARYFKNKYNQDFTVVPASESQDVVDWVNRILKDEHNIVIAAKPLETCSMHLKAERWGDVRWDYVFYDNGLGINVVYSPNDPKGRAVGFKLTEGMQVPAELSGFKFARQKSRLAGTIRGSYFVIKGEY